jgi:hypothetical protein
MKQNIFYVFVSLSFAVMLMGCAHWGGDSPLGITGGSDEGYGKDSDLDLPDPANGLDSELLGSWWYDINDNSYDLFTFNSDGTFSYEAYYRDHVFYSYDGTFSTSVDKLTLNYNNESVTIAYSIRGNRLTLHFEQETQTYTRVLIDKIVKEFQ